MFGEDEGASEPASGAAPAADYVWFLEAMDAIERALRSSDDLELMLMRMLEAARAAFRADRAWTSTPLDPDAREIDAPFVCSIPEYVVPATPYRRVPLPPELAAAYQRCLASPEPVSAGEGCDLPLEPVLAEMLQIRSVLMMAVRPAVGPPWAFGLHQCSRARQWTPVERRLLQEMGRRLGDALSMLLKHRELEASEGRFKALFEQGADAMFLTAEDGRILDANAQACAHTGRLHSELVNMSLAELMLGTNDRDDALWRAPLGPEPIIAERELAKKQGGTLPVEVNARRALISGSQVVIAVARDITARRRAEQEKARLEERLRHAQKMQAIGQLAGGVAHDFNNLLTAIQGNVEFALERISTGGDPAATVEDLEHAVLVVDRAARLTRQLLVFGRRDTVNTQIIDVNQTVEGIGVMLRRLLPETISFEISLSCDVQPIRGDVSQLEQIVVNLAVNARDAMPSGGTLAIETANVQVDQELARHHPEARPGPYVMLALGDSGVGIAPEIAQRIFEPFFSTKPSGHGTGLGLATCDTIVRQHGGFMVFYTMLGRGTTFRVFLPALPFGATPHQAVHAQAASRGGTETILLCEDDASVSRLAERALTSAGYEVLVAKDGREGVDIAARHSGAIHLLVSDVIMPYMNGRQLTQALLRARPSLRVLYVSGHTSNVLAHHGVVAPELCFLGKPYSTRALLAKVRETLDTPTSLEAPTSPA